MQLNKMNMLAANSWYLSPARFLAAYHCAHHLPPHQGNHAHIVHKLLFQMYAHRKYGPVKIATLTFGAHFRLLWCRLPIPGFGYVLNPVKKITMSRRK